MPFTVGYFPFYSAILGFLGYHWFLHSLPWVLETLVGWFLPHFSLFSSFGVSSSKASCWLSALRCPKELTFGLSSSRLLDPIFSDLTFGCLSLYHFSQVSWFLPAMLKVSQAPSFMVLLFGFPEVPGPYSWIVGS